MKNTIYTMKCVKNITFLLSILVTVTCRSQLFYGKEAGILNFFVQILITVHDLCVCGAVCFQKLFFLHWF
jgi:hypothetical protein